jgi:hypothetical protein
MTPENRKWVNHEIFEILKQASAVIVATVTLGGFVVTTWKYLNLPVPLSAATHQRDMKSIQDQIVNQYAQLKRETLANRLEVMQMRITNIANEIHNAEDAIAVHTRSLNFTEMTAIDKEVARRRIINLTEAKDTWVTRQRAIYIHMDKIREAMNRLPYDPKLGDIYNYTEVPPNPLEVK